MENCAWYIYNGNEIFVQKLLGEWHYWNFMDGWHPLTDIVRQYMVYSKELNKHE
jgi:hypothetical protein